MTQTKYSYDLTEAPWVPVLMNDGSSAMLGLRSLFAQAPDIRGLACPSPMAEAGLFCMLLAIAHRVHAGPNDARAWRKLYEGGAFETSRCDAYFDRWRRHFDLFDEATPFFQVAGLTTIGGSGAATPTDVTRLAVQWSAGNNATLFDHHIDGNGVVSAAEAARLLVATQVFALGGGKGPKSNRFGAHPYASHAPGVGALMTFVDGGSLFYSLVSNMVPTKNRAQWSETSGNGDKPAWEQEKPRPPGQVTPLGYLDYLTLQARCIRLLPQGSAQAPVVRTMYYAPGLSVSNEFTSIRRPFAAHVVTKKGDVVPVAQRVDRALWRDSGALLAQPIKGDSQGVDKRPLMLSFLAYNSIARGAIRQRLLSVTTYGLANDKAKPLVWRRASLSVPLTVVHDDDKARLLQRALEVSGCTESALRTALHIVAKEMLQDCKDGAPDTKDVSRVRTRLLAKADFWSGLEPLYGEFLAELPIDSTAALTQWVRGLEDRARYAFTNAAKHAAGSLSRSLRTQVAGKRVLDKGLAAIRREFSPQQTTPIKATS